MATASATSTASPQRLDYLQALGIDAVWLTPIYPSPQVDFGYDISDYNNIDPQYGTLADFDRLVAEAKKRNIGVIMDLVLNHTSDKHPWFMESPARATIPKPTGTCGTMAKMVNGHREPPNNWLSVFGHSAWQWDDPRASSTTITTSTSSNPTSTGTTRKFAKPCMTSALLDQARRGRLPSRRHHGTFRRSPDIRRTLRPRPRRQAEDQRLWR